MKDSMDYSPPGSSVCGIIPTRILEWVAIPFSRGSSQPRDRTCVSSIDMQIFYHWTTWEAIKSLPVDIFLQGFGCRLAMLKCKEVIFWLFQSKESFEFLFSQPSLLLLFFFFFCLGMIIIERLCLKVGLMENIKMTA